VTKGLKGQNIIAQVERSEAWEFMEYYIQSPVRTAFKNINIVLTGLRLFLYFHPGLASLDLGYHITTFQVFAYSSLFSRFTLKHSKNDFVEKG